MSELKLTEDANPDFDFDGLVNKKKLTNVEVAKVIRAMVRAQKQLNENQFTLQKQFVHFGERIDRLEQLILDQPKEGGGIRSGLARSLQATQQELADVNGRMSDIYLTSQALTRMLPWAVRNPEATDEELAGVFAAIRDELIKEGEEAAKAWPIAKEIGERQYACAGCRFWRDEPAVQVPGQTVTAGCTKKFVQVLCPRCGHLYGPPVDPNDVKGECPKCKTTLQREVEMPDDKGKRTLCKVFETDTEKLIAALREAQIPEALIEQIVPKTSESSAP